MFEKQSIGGAAKQENQQVACTSGETALDVESLPVQMAVRKPKPNPAVGKCSVDQEKWCTYDHPYKQEVEKG